MAVKRHKILLLEDDSVRALIFESAIRRGLGELSTCADVPGALRRLKMGGFDLCVVDLGVFAKPGRFDPRGGLDFIANARSDITRTVPMVVVTSVRDAGVLIPCFEAGADDYVVKDETMEATFTRIQSWLSGAPYTSAYLEQKRREVIHALRAREGSAGGA